MHVAILLRKHPLKQQFRTPKYQRKLTQFFLEISEAKANLCLISKSLQPFIAPLGEIWIRFSIAKLQGSESCLCHQSDGFSSIRELGLKLTSCCVLFNHEARPSPLLLHPRVGRAVLCSQSEEQKDK